MRRNIIIGTIIVIIVALTLGAVTVGARQYTYQNLYDELDKVGAEKKYDDQGLFISKDTLAEMENELEKEQAKLILSLKKSARNLGLDPDAIISGAASKEEQIRLLEKAIDSVSPVEQSSNTSVEDNPKVNNVNDDSNTQGDDSNSQGNNSAGDDSVTHDVNDDNGVDDPATHDVNDDNGVDVPATHDVNDDNGVDDPATHDVNDDK